MQYVKLTRIQRRIRAWRMRRNHAVCEILAANPNFTRGKAMRLAIEQVGKMPREKKKKKKKKTRKKGKKT